MSDDTLKKAIRALSHWGTTNMGWKSDASGRSKLRPGNSVLLNAGERPQEKQRARKA